LYRYATASGDGLTWQRIMAAGLQTLSWHHVDVEFPGFLPLAHNKICALGRTRLFRWLFKDGEVIVAHQADYLLAWQATRASSSRGGVAGESARGREAKDKDE
jgi:hypothetical protein